MAFDPGNNSYVTLDEANQFFADHLFNTLWIDAATTDDMKERALVTASALLDSSFNWVGVKTPVTPDTIIEWPRTNAFNRCTEEDIQEDETPQDIKDATCIEANYLLSLTQHPGTPQAALLKGITEAKLDVMAVKFDLQQIKEASLVIPNTVDDLLRCFAIPVDNRKDWVNAYTQRA